ncbi:hypothetical protein HanRHA438_Chr10g0453261 [Helianthus annuus]|nr:hypothetical protein HanRHA438_Chr10g0453261 [Helianthus annuus]
MMVKTSSRHHLEDAYFFEKTMIEIADSRMAFLSSGSISFPRSNAASSLKMRIPTCFKAA